MGNEETGSGCRSVGIVTGFGAAGLLLGAAAGGALGFLIAYLVYMTPNPDHAPDSDIIRPLRESVGFFVGLIGLAIGAIGGGGIGALAAALFGARLAARRETGGINVS